MVDNYIRFVLFGIVFWLSLTSYRMVARSRDVKPGEAMSTIGLSGFWGAVFFHSLPNPLAPRLENAHFAVSLLIMIPSIVLIFRGEAIKHRRELVERFADRADEVTARDFPRAGWWKWGVGFLFLGAISSLMLLGAKGSGVLFVFVLCLCTSIVCFGIQGLHWLSVLSDVRAVRRMQRGRVDSTD